MIQQKIDLPQKLENKATEAIRKERDPQQVQPFRSSKKDSTKTFRIEGNQSFLKWSELVVYKAIRLPSSTCINVSRTTISRSTDIRTEDLLTISHGDFRQFLTESSFKNFILSHISSTSCRLLGGGSCTSKQAPKPRASGTNAISGANSSVATGAGQQQHGSNTVVASTTQTKQSQQNQQQLNNSSNQKIYAAEQVSGSAQKNTSSAYQKRKKSERLMLNGGGVAAGNNNEDHFQYEYTYQLNEEQVNKINSIVSRLKAMNASEGTVAVASVPKFYLEIFETFSPIFSQGLTSPATQIAFQTVLETCVNFLLSITTSANAMKVDAFDPETQKRIIAKISKLQRLFYRFQSRLPLQISLFLLSFQKKIVLLSRKTSKQNQENPSSNNNNNNSNIPLHQQHQYSKQFPFTYTNYCFGGFAQANLGRLEDLMNSIQVYYEYNEDQKFVVDLLKTETDILRKYTQVQRGEVLFETYFESILEDNQYRAFSSIAYGYLMLFDQIFESCVKFNSAANASATSAKISETELDVAVHFVRLVSGSTFLSLCDDTFYFQDLVSLTSQKNMYDQLKHNLFMRYVELRVLNQTYKLVLAIQAIEKKEKRTVFQSQEHANINTLKEKIFEKFVLEASVEVNCLIFDDEVMLSMVETLSKSLPPTFFAQLKERIIPEKQRLASFLIENVGLTQSPADENNCKPSSETAHRYENLFEQILKRKVNYSIVLRDPITALSNRFIEAFINRIASKNDESQHEKGQLIHVKQRLKFISQNQISRSDINIDGFVEDPLMLFEKYFLAESNTKVNVIALKGGAGIGKTHLCRVLARSLMKSIKQTGSRSIAIPIIVSMTEVQNSESHKDLEQFLIASIQRYAFRSAAEISYLKNSSIPKVIILDGLSEWAWGSPSLSIRKWIRLREWQNTKLIITYRKPFVRPEEFPYFFGQKFKQPADLVQGAVSPAFGNVIASANTAAAASDPMSTVAKEDEREHCFEVLKVLPLTQECVEDYVRQKEWQIHQEFDKLDQFRDDQSIMTDNKSFSNFDQVGVSGAQNDKQSRSQNDSVVQRSKKNSVFNSQANSSGGTGTAVNTILAGNLSANIQQYIRPGFLVNALRTCIAKNTHLIEMLKEPFNLFCFVEMLAKVPGIKEIYWGGGGSVEERRQTATWLSNSEEMQERIFIEELNGMITESGITESLRELSLQACVEFFQALAMSFFIERSFMATLREVRELVHELKHEMGASEKAAFEKVIVTMFSNISRTSFLASSDASFFCFVTGSDSHPHDALSSDDLVSANVDEAWQVYSFRNIAWLEFFVARAMKNDFDTHGANNRVHALPLSKLTKFAINQKYLLEERSSGEHLPFSISQWTNHASIEMHILAKLASLIRKDLLSEDFQLKLQEKDIANMHRYMQVIQRTRRHPKKVTSTDPNMYTTEDWVIKQQKHPLDIASSNMLSAICYNKMTLSKVKLRNCSFSRAYLYGYRGEIDIGCSDVTEANLRGSSVYISRSKFMHCLLDDEKKNHERWTSFHAYSFASLHFPDSRTLIAGSNFGGISVFKANNDQQQQQKNNNNKPKPTTNSSGEDWKEDSLTSWEITSHQRQFQEEVRGLSSSQGDFFYCFQNVIAHVSENGEEKELVMGHTNRINGIDICLKLSYLASVSSDRTCRIWGIQSAANNRTGQKQKTTDEDLEESFAEMDLLYTLTNHEAEITCVQFSPNAMYLATGSYDENVILYDIASKFTKTNFFRVRNDWITSLSFSPDSSILAAGSSLGFVKLWDISSLKTFEFPTVRLADLAKESEYIQNQAAPVIQEIDATKDIVSSKANRELVGGVNCVKFSPGTATKYLVFSCFEGPGLQVWEYQTKKDPNNNNSKKPLIEFTFAKLLNLDITKSAKHIADIHEKKLIESYFLVNQIAFSPDGKLLAASSLNQTVCTIWEVPQSTNKLAVVPFKMNAAMSPTKITALALSNDGRFLATTGGTELPLRDSKRITLWTMMKKGEQAVIVQTLDAQAHNASVLSIAFSPFDLLIASGDDDGTVVIWKSHTTSSQNPTENNNNNNRKASGNSNQINAAAAYNQIAYKPIKKFLAHANCAVTSLAFSPKQIAYLVTCSSEEKSIKLWDALNGYSPASNQLKTTQQQSEKLPFHRVEFAPDCSYLVALPIKQKNEIFEQSCIYVWSIVQQQLPANKVQLEFNILEEVIGTIKSNSVGRSFSTTITAIGFSKDSALFATGQSNGLCVIWNASQKFQFLQSIDAHFNSVSQLIFSQDSQMLATSGLDSTCRLWHVPNRFNAISSFYVPNEISALEFVRSGHSIAISSYSDEFCLKFYDVFSPSYAMEELRAHSLAISASTFSGDGRFLITAAQDNSCRIWDSKNNFQQHLTINMSYLKQKIQQSASQAATTTTSNLSTKSSEKTADTDPNNYKHLAAIDFAIDEEDESSQSSNDSDNDADDNANTNNNNNNTNNENYRILTHHYRRIHHAHHHKKRQNPNNPSKAGGVNQLIVNPLDKKRHSFTAPQLKPSQKYQLKVNELAKDEAQIDQDNLDDADAGGIIAAVISFKGTYVLVISAESNTAIQILDLTRGIDDLRHSFVLASNPKNALPPILTCLALSKHDEFLAAGSSNKDIYIFKNTSILGLEFEQHKVISNRHTKSISCLAFSPDNKYFASGSWDITCRVYSVESDFQMIHNLDGQYGYILSVAFSPDSKHVAIASRDASCYVWDISNRLSVAELFDHKQAITAVNFSPNHMVTAAKDGAFVLYDWKDEYKVIRKIDQLQDIVSHAELSPDGKYLVLAFPNSNVQVWDLFSQYDLTIELNKDPLFKQIMDMEKAVNAPQQPAHETYLGDNNSFAAGGGSQCNFFAEESIDVKEREQEQKEVADLKKELPEMKKNVITTVFKATYPSYQEYNNLNFELTETDDHHLLVTVPKYPYCSLTL